MTSRDHCTPIHPGQAACSQVFMQDRRTEYDNKREREERWWGGERKTNMEGEAQPHEGFS